MTLPLALIIQRGLQLIVTYGGSGSLMMKFSPTPIQLLLESPYTPYQLGSFTVQPIVKKPGEVLPRFQMCEPS